MHNNSLGIEIPERLVQKHLEHQAKGLESRTVAKWDYCTINEFGQVDEVYCKCCGVRIMGPRDWGDPQVYKANDKTNTVIVRQRVRIMPFDNYSMTIIEMEDGSQHLTVACKACCKKLQDAAPHELQHVYIADLASLASSAGTTQDMAVIDQMHNRTPKRVL